MWSSMPPDREETCRRAIDKGNGSEPLGFEDVLWKAADKLRGSMDASEYKHVVPGLIFLKYAEDAFEERRAVLRDELTAEGLDVRHLVDLISGIGLGSAEHRDKDILGA